MCIAFALPRAIASRPKCTGNSTKLDPAQCSAWVDFYDAMGGDHWTYCSDARADPCGVCVDLYGKRLVCSEDGAYVDELYAAPPPLHRSNPAVPRLDYCTMVAPLCIRHLQTNNLTGLLPASVTAWVNITYFNVFDNHLQGSLPQGLGSAWGQLTGFNVEINELEGALPSLPFQNMARDKNGCILLDPRDGGDNKFSCPWPPYVTRHCLKLVASGSVLITNSDCVA